MLYPQTNRCRTVIDLSGFWQIKVDKEEEGLRAEWPAGFIPEAFVGVPGSWNEQLAELGLMNFSGSIWYETNFHVPTAIADQRLILRFGSADFAADVWVNGETVGSHLGGYLPFAFDVTSQLRRDGSNRLVVRVDNQLNHDTIPQGVSSSDYASFGKQRDETYPPTVFDFLAYGGLARPVKLVALNEKHLRALKLETSIEGEDGHVRFVADFTEANSAAACLTLWAGEDKVAEHKIKLTSNTLRGEFEVPKCRFWSPDDPHLYRLEVQLTEKGKLLDEYSSACGVREITTEGDDLLLNGKPVFLQGFGKHEDFAVLGKGLSYPLVVKDFRLMKWIGANSFRTSHYPYAEEVMQMADRMGFLVIDEVPAVSLNFKYVTEQTLQNHKQALTELIARDRNHPSVIAWSIANEPGIWGEQEAISSKAEKYWSEIYSHVKDLDPSRPVTLPTCAVWGEQDPAYKYSDFVSINRYWGWYEIPGDIEKAGAMLKSELEGLYKKFNKPILVSEFGADTIDGEHATYPQMFTEEYQVQLIMKYFDVIEALPFTVGEHIWNFADFRTAQHFRRVILNKKGVFTRSREPKAAAFAVRDHWRKA